MPVPCIVLRRIGDVGLDRGHECPGGAGHGRRQRLDRRRWFGVAEHQRWARALARLQQRRDLVGRELQRVFDLHDPVLLDQSAPDLEQRPA
jgi:hypothetical protein